MKVRSKKKNRELSAIEAFQVDTKKICRNATMLELYKLLPVELDSQK